MVFLTVFDRYTSYSPYDIKESIRKEVKGDLERSFITLGEAATPSAVCSVLTLVPQTSSLCSRVLPKQTTLLRQQTQRSHEGTGWSPWQRADNCFDLCFVTTQLKSWWRSWCFYLGRFRSNVKFVGCFYLDCRPGPPPSVTRTHFLSTCRVKVQRRRW